jgi:TolB-like protein
VNVAQKRSDVPGTLASIIMRCLEKDPASRPASAAEVLTMLESVTSSDPIAGAPARTNRGSRKRSVAAIGAILVVVIAAVAAAMQLYKRDDVPAVKSIAVLPLENLSGDKANDYFGEGLSEEITGTLSRAGIKVVGRRSSFSLRAKGLSAGEIGRELHASSVLHGSVQRSGDRVRINVTLVSAPDETVLWSEKFDRDLKDVFAVQDEIAKAVAGELKVKLASDGPRRADTQDPEAHTAYLQGLYLWNRRSAPALHKAIGLFAEAVRRDPAYAQAYGGLAMAYTVMPAYDDIDNGDMLARAREAAARALALDSQNVQALTALAYVEALEYRNKASDDLFHRAIAADSGFATAHFWHGLLYLQQMRNEEALASIEKARTLEPASLVINTAMTQVLYDMRRYVDAEKSSRAVLQLDSTIQLGVIDYAKVLVENGKAAEAVRMVQPIVDVPGMSHLEKVGVLAYALARAGRANEASQLLRKAEAESNERTTQRGMVAAAFDAIGEREKAIQILRAAVDDHDLWLAHYLSAAPYDGLRTDPRVRSMLDLVSNRGDAKAR